MPSPAVFDELLAGSGDQAVSTTMAFTRLLRNLCRDPGFGAAGRADHPRRGPHVRHGRAVPGVQHLRRRRASATNRWTTTCCCPTRSPHDGQILEEGITEAGGLAIVDRGATSYAHRGVPMVPFFIFYSMFGFQRVGDLIWAAADARARGFLMGATAGRTTLARRGPPAPGRPQPRAGLHRALCRAYDPAFAYEMAADRPGRHGTACTRDRSSTARTSSTT